jgi:hypothetical protein
VIHRRFRGRTGKHCERVVIALRVACLAPKFLSAPVVLIVKRGEWIAGPGVIFVAAIRRFRPVGGTRGTRVGFKRGFRFRCLKAVCFLGVFSVGTRGTPGTRAVWWG